LWKRNLDFHPNETDEDLEDGEEAASLHTSLYLFSDVVPAAHVEVRLGIKGMLEEGQFITVPQDYHYPEFDESEEDNEQAKRQANIGDFSMGYGLAMLLSHNELFAEENHFIVNGNLTLQCEVSVGLEDFR
jgi:hypothetical protein